MPNLVFKKNQLDIITEGSAMVKEDIKIVVKGKNNKLIVCDGAKLGTLGTPKIEFLGNNQTFRIDSKVVIKRGHYRMVGDGTSIEIGEKTTINGAYFLCDNASISIGIDCMFSNDIELRTTDAHSLIDKNSGLTINPPMSISIGDHCWIGKQACLLQGVTLGSNIIVGTRALVTKSFCEEFTAIAGVPAKVVRQHVEWNRKPPKLN